MWKLSMLLALAACAQGTMQHVGGDDAKRDSSGQQLDAPPPDAKVFHDARPPGDAHVFHDAPAQHDAPAGSCTQPFSGVLATWDFSAQPGNQASTPASSTAPGVTAGVFTRSAGINAVSGAGSINSDTWTLNAARDTTKYYTLTIAPPTGCKISLTSLSVDALSSATGPASASAATSADSFASTSSVSTSAPSTPTLSVTNASGTIEIRIYGYAAGTTAGTMRIRNTFSASGSIQ